MALRDRGESLRNAARASRGGRIGVGCHRARAASKQPFGCAVSVVALAGSVASAGAHGGTVGRGEERTLSTARPIVIVGLPRSGTTWTSEVLGRAGGVMRISEPDNEDKHPAAIHAKRRVGRYPVLGPTDDDRDYRRLWEWILSGAPEGRRDRFAHLILKHGLESRIYEGRHDLTTWLGGTVARSHRPAPAARGRVVSKSIHLQLAVEWLVSAFDVEVLVLFRHPANVLASWMEVNLKDGRNTTLETRADVRRRYVDRWGVPLPGPDPLERMCWRIGLLLAALEESAGRHPEWHRRGHERLCDDPAAEFRQLYDELGLTWTATAANYLEEKNAPGTGFQLKRVASELSDSWRDRLDDRHLDVLRQTLSLFPISMWTDRDFERGAGAEL
jgi:Sulfotransferase family